MLKLNVSVFLGLALLLAPVAGLAHPADENPDLTLPETTREFRQDRYGMFIHWGLYSVLCDGDRVMRARDIPLSDYERLALFFNPAEFDAAGWVALAKAAGMRYIVFTCKSPDGFAMWDSRVSDFNVVDMTPFGRDVVKELAEECHRQGIKLFVYYSAQDWRYPEQARDAGGPAALRAAGDLADGVTTSSLEIMNLQLRELLTNYGKIAGVWLDGFAGRPGAAMQLQPTYDLIRKLEPAALIGTNHGRAPMAGEDFQMDGAERLAEAFAPGEQLEYSPVPLEISQTINDSRGYRITDNDFKSQRELVHDLVRAAGTDANLALHIGPMPNGQVQQEFQDRLRRVGMWLAKHGESIYATRGGPMAPQPWGVTTHRGSKVYVHVLDAETTTVELQLPTRVRTAQFLIDESDVPFEQNEEGRIILKLRPERRTELERLVVLRMRHEH